jgi:hypothetical protein
METPSNNKSLDAKERNELPASVYAFPDKRKEALHNASHVRNAIARSIRRRTLPIMTRTSLCEY